MKIEFDRINLSFENMDGNDERLKRISHLIWKLLDEKFERDANNSSSNSSNFPTDTMKKPNIVILDEITVPPIRVDSGRSDYDIASRCASAIYQAVLTKLQ
jgi:hypothetical protein